MPFKKKYLLIIVAIICIGLYFYGQYTKDSEYLKHLPVVGGLAFGLNTLVNLAQSEEQVPEELITKPTQKQI